MENEQTKCKTSVGAMRKNPVTMADGRRYLIYYTFEGNSESGESGDKLPETFVKPEMTEERNV